MIYATFSSEGLPLAFYNEAVHGTRSRPIYGEAPETTEENPSPARPIVGEEPNPDTLIPVDASEITEDQWQEFLSNQSRRRWDGESVVAYDPPPPPLTSADIDAEHDRRVALGKAFDLGGVTVAPDGSDKTQLVIMALDRNAQQLKAAGVSAAIFPFTDRDNVDHLLTPDQIIGLMSAGSGWVQAMHNAKRDLKNAASIPADYADDAYWP